MEYRIHPKTGEKISVIGLGSSALSDASEAEAVEALVFAHDHGINYMEPTTSANNAHKRTRPFSAAGRKGPCSFLFH